MKCTNRKKWILSLLLVISTTLGCGKSEVLINYETKTFNQSNYSTDLFAVNLVNPIEDLSLSGFACNTAISGTALFCIDTGELLQSKNLLVERAPASTTKVMTAYVALKYGNLDDIITISTEAMKIPSDSSTAGLRVGDMLTLYDLLVGLTARSGNEAAMAIAEYISGSSEAFAELMTQEAHALGATNTYFKNPHGYDAEGHTTTIYDLYLMFNAAISYDTYKEILADTSYVTSIKNEDGSERSVEWIPTNYYHQGRTRLPYNFSVIGGKTGTTSQAGNCLVILMEHDNGNEYVCIVMGSPSRDVLYANMTELMEAIPK